MKTVFLRALEAEDKSAALLAAIRAPEAAQGKQRFDVDPAKFAEVTRSPFAYWVSDRLRQVFSKLPPFEGDGRVAKQGLATSDDFRFVRGWWAVPQQAVHKVWFSFTKGGSFSPFYRDVSLCVDWRSEGAQSWAIYEARRDIIGGIIKNPDFYFRPGLTWPLRGIRFSAQAVPSGCIFSIAGKMAFVEKDELPWFLVLFNSLAFDKFIAFFAGKIGGVQYEVGLIQYVPVPNASAHEQMVLVALGRRGWSLMRAFDTRIETAHAFTLPALLQTEGYALADRSTDWSKRIKATEAELLAIQAEIDLRCFDLYDIDEADRRAITEGFDKLGDSAQDAAPPDGEGDTDEAEEAAADAATLTAELVSWAVGVAFGRFDVRLATGARALPPEPEPFDALPVCSPAMLTGEDGLPLSAAPAGYPLKFPENGILVDDPGHPLDLTAAVRAVFDVVFGADAHARWNEAAALLDPKEQNLRNWLSRGFFEQHLKRHSKSRRKAPIVWQLATASSSYAVWLYAHRVNKDTFFQVQNDLVAKKLFHEEGVQTKLEKEAATSPSPALRKALAAQSTLLEELRTLLDEVKRIAALWQPNLDDGVVLTMAPLFRLVPQHKPWQKELKAGWDGLAAGKFDWAHLAMHLWPERVVPKCATDRSLAIAHGLEDVFWVEATEGKWKARPAPTRSVDDLTRDRTSSAVKASLKSLVEAPIVGGGGTKRGKKPRAHD